MHKSKEETLNTDTFDSILCKFAVQYMVLAFYYFNNLLYLFIGHLSH